MFTLFCITTPIQFQNISFAQKRTLSPLSNPFLALTQLPPTPGDQHSALCLDEFTCSECFVSCKWNQTICILLFHVLVSVSKVHPCCSKHHYFLPFLDQVIFHFMYILHLIYPFINRWTFGLLPLPIFVASNIQLS